MIHILRHGAAMCGLPGVPSSWPTDDRWVSFEDPERRDKADCNGCLKQDEPLVKTPRRDDSKELVMWSTTLPIEKGWYWAREVGFPETEGIVRFQPPFHSGDPKPNQHDPDGVVMLSGSNDFMNPLRFEWGPKVPKLESYIPVNIEGKPATRTTIAEALKKAVTAGALSIGSHPMIDLAVKLNTEAERKRIDEEMKKLPDQILGHGYVSGASHTWPHRGSIESTITLKLRQAVVEGGPPPLQIQPSGPDDLSAEVWLIDNEVVFRNIPFRGKQ